VRRASQRFFIHSCIYLRILIISYLASFLGTDSLSVLIFCSSVKQSINQSINQPWYWYTCAKFHDYIGHINITFFYSTYLIFHKMNVFFNLWNQSIQHLCFQWLLKELLLHFAHSFCVVHSICDLFTVSVDNVLLVIPQLRHIWCLFSVVISLFFSVVSNAGSACV